MFGGGVSSPTLLKTGSLKGGGLSFRVWGEVGLGEMEGVGEVPGGWPWLRVPWSGG